MKRLSNWLGGNGSSSLHKQEEPVNGKILRRCKGGAEVSLIDLGLVAFLPGSMIDEAPMKNFDHLIGQPQKFAIVKLDMQRGNVVSFKETYNKFFQEADEEKAYRRI